MLVVTELVTAGVSSHIKGIGFELSKPKMIC